MPDAEVPSIVDRENDRLYRKVDPDQWNRETNQLEAVAFQDPGKTYTKLSFFVRRYKTAEQVLDYFAGMTPTKDAVGCEGRASTRQMYDRGYRIAEIAASSIAQLGLQYVSKENREIKPTGHVDVADGQNHAVRLLRHARLLTEEEIFGNR